jgi:hypothetical protein
MLYWEREGRDVEKIKQQKLGTKEDLGNLINLLKV